MYLNTEILRTENVYNSFERVLVGIRIHVGQWLLSNILFE